MPNDSKLLDLNPQLGMLNGLYQDTANPFRETNLSNYLQIAALDVFDNAQDVSLFSHDIKGLLNTDELRLEFNTGKHNYLQLMNFEGVENSLDLTQDFGGVTHYLGSRGISVDSIKVDVDRTRISSYRCAELKNITHISEDLEKLVFPTSHYDLIMISDLTALGIKISELPTLINRLKSALSETGALLISAVNRHRISKLLAPDAVDKPNAIPYLDLYQDSSDQLPSREDLVKLVESSGLKSQVTYATYSNDGEFQNLFSEHYLTNNPNAINHFYRIGALENKQINEYLLFRNIHNGNHSAGLLDCASRYLILAGADTYSLNKVYNYDFAHFPGTSRKPEWRAITHLSSGSETVVKTKVAMTKVVDTQVAKTKADSNSFAPALSQTTEDGPLLRGRILVDKWLQVVLDNDHLAFESLLSNYVNWLATASQDGDFAAFGYDALPFNILIDPADDNQTYQLFDTEWSLSEKLQPEFVLFRALFWFAFQNRSLLKGFAEARGVFSIGDFVSHHMFSFFETETLQPFTALEENIQAQISNKFRAGSIELALSQTFTEDAADEDIESGCQITWGNSHGEFDEANSLFIDIAEAAGADQLSSSRVSCILPSPNKQNNVLRIDPVASHVPFSFDGIKIMDQQDSVIFQLDSAKAIVANAQVSNAQLINQAEPYFQTLNNDPHFNFDLSAVAGFESATKIELKISRIEVANLEQIIESLSERLSSQTQFTERQTNTVNRYRAELEFLSQRLEDAKRHRTDLNAMLVRNVELTSRNAYYKEMQMELYQQKKRDVHRVNLQIENVHAQLIDQLKRNDEMHHFLMIRPTTRAKRLLSRTFSRLMPGSGDNTDAGNDDSAEQQQPATELSPDNAQNASSADSATQTPEHSIEADEIDGVPESNEQQPTETAAAPADEPEPNIFPYSGELIGQNIEDYQLWIEQNELNEEQLAEAKQDIEDMVIKPVFSILVPIYNTDPEYLLPMIRSVQAQLYPHWQLCLVDDASPKEYLKLILEDEAAKDPRITLLLNQENQGISLTSNDALAAATGDYIALLDHDDEISINALYENAKVINQHPDVGLIYSDEDKMDMQGNRLEPYFKPDYSPDLLHTNNYICHFTIIKKSIADSIGGFSEGLDGSQDHDIILRSIEQSERIVHIPKILYHWRKIPGSTAVEYDSKSYAWEAGRVAVERNLQAKETGVKVEFGTLKGTYRVDREIKGLPLVSIVIPFKDQPKLLHSCLESIRFLSSYVNFEVVGVSNNSELPETFEKMRCFEELDERIRFVEKNIPFNFSAICNYGVSQAKGDYVILLNNDVEIKSNNWIEGLLEHAQRPEIGAVGGKLLYPDGRIQHAGVVVGMVGAAGHPHKFFPDNHIGYHGRLHMVYNVSAVTGAMLMVSKQKYQEVGGLDEDNLAVAYNDIDFCLKLMDKGYLNIFTPHAKATHHESVSRGYEDTPEKMDRLLKEQGHFLETWKDFIAKGDPFYNPNLSLENERFSLKFKN